MLQRFGIISNHDSQIELVTKENIHKLQEKLIQSKSSMLIITTNNHVRTSITKHDHRTRLFL